jgi:hypothetical protein
MRVLALLPGLLVLMACGDTLFIPKPTLGYHNVAAPPLPPKVAAPPPPSEIATPRPTSLPQPGTPPS